MANTLQLASTIKYIKHNYMYSARFVQVPGHHSDGEKAARAEQEANVSTVLIHVIMPLVITKFQ